MSLVEIAGYTGLNEWFLLYSFLHIVAFSSVIFCLIVLLKRSQTISARANNSLALSYLCTLIPYHLIQFTMLVLKGIFDFQDPTPPSEIVQILLVLACDNLPMVILNACLITGVFFFLSLVVKIRSGRRPLPNWFAKTVSSTLIVNLVIVISCLVSIVTFAINQKGYLPIYYLNFGIEAIALALDSYLGIAIAIDLIGLLNQPVKTESKTRTATMHALVRLLLTSVIIFLILVSSLYFQHISAILNGSYFIPYGLTPVKPVGFSISLLMYTLPGTTMLLVFRKPSNDASASNVKGSSRSQSVITGSIS